MRAQYASLLIGALVLLCLSGILIWKGVPMLLGGVVRLVPVEWEDRLGKMILDGVDRPENRCDDAETLAMVGAVVQRLVRALGIQTVLSLMLGDPGVLGGLAGNLGILHFMRSDEESADDGALETLEKAGIPPVEMVRAFENLEEFERKHGASVPIKYI